MNALSQPFTQAQTMVTSLSHRPSNADLLTLYSLFKQATEGDVVGDRPGVMDFVARAKFDAWAALTGMASADAMQKYVDTVDSLLASDE